MSSEARLSNNEKMRYSQNRAAVRGRSSSPEEGELLLPAYPDVTPSVLGPSAGDPSLKSSAVGAKTEVSLKDERSN
jgi:hypothetical protein